MIVTPSTIDLNTFQVRQARVSCLRFLPLREPLRARTPPDIVCPFLLDDVAFTNQYAEAAKGASGFRLPWGGGYAQLFWDRYVPSEKPDELWRALVPVEFDLSPVMTSLQLADGKVSAKAFLYPWGIGFLIDVAVEHTLPLAATVDRLIEIHNRPSISWNTGTETGKASPSELASEIQKRVLPLLYGKGIEPEELGEETSIATIVDADNINVTEAIAEGGPLHYVLAGLAGWKAKWKVIQPAPGSLEDCRIASASAPAGHILYGKGRSRAIWFPADFSSASDYPDTLNCYHRNLSMATLHTEALCVLAQDAAAQLALRGSLVDVSIAYYNCARLAAGLLGRLHGRKSDDSPVAKPTTYRSGSVRAQIRIHKDEIDRLRLALLAGGTPLDS
jgi:hypothetical protein